MKGGNYWLDKAHGSSGRSCTSILLSLDTSQGIGIPNQEANQSCTYTIYKQHSVRQWHAWGDSWEAILTKLICKSLLLLRLLTALAQQTLFPISTPGLMVFHRPACSSSVISHKPPHFHQPFLLPIQLKDHSSTRSLHFPLLLLEKLVNRYHKKVCQLSITACHIHLYYYNHILEWKYYKASKGTTEMPSKNH